MKHLLFLLAVTLMVSCKEDKTAKQEADLVANDAAVTLEVYNFNELEPLLSTQDNKTYVVNFWATWCKPCVKELPYFEKLKSNYQDKNVELLLVSLDFPNKYESKLKPFIKAHNLKSKVVALDDPDMNAWIPKVSEDWSGAIPATLIFNKDRRQFFEKTFTYQALETEVKSFLN
ncbi:thioredoxin [Mangrovimonas yunxiaonensis]|uniref:Thioredoxin n=1 Tax=Mangrovimonas yunxiaonensis TaxID=1197477 RepID=A0A084TNV8_9FLAO|nr:redoxin domain-containing protein [Mangrovimonas yunxiaonensis]KFB02394.1 thioredoxin [Mangrovimonas yunxiaonensis]GGH40068.1 hypothetical protein GCM10011364_09920 [Mangrovimonas yunxiaonensis]